MPRAPWSPLHMLLRVSAFENRSLGGSVTTGLPSIPDQWSSGIVCEVQLPQAPLLMFDMWVTKGDPEVTVG